MWQNADEYIRQLVCETASWVENMHTLQSIINIKALLRASKIDLTPFLRDMDTPSQRLLRGESIFFTGGVGLRINVTKF